MTAASSPEDSGTAAPDPRIGAINLFWFSHPGDGETAADVLAVADAADRAAGVIRVRTDDVEGIARKIAASYGDSVWHIYVDSVKDVLEALVTP